MAKLVILFLLTTGLSAIAASKDNAKSCIDAYRGAYIESARMDSGSPSSIWSWVWSKGLHDGQAIYAIYIDALNGIVYDSSETEAIIRDLGIAPSQRIALISELVKQMESGDLCTEEKEIKTRQEILNSLNKVLVHSGR